tara:strand:- start:1033 stop:1530 length:498 start_codon:yes stop_codon:yes gene_type:complete
MSLLLFLQNMFDLDALIIFLIAAAPIGELRVAIPYGILLTQVPFLNVLILSVVGNIFSGIFIIYFFPKIIIFLSKINFIDKLYKKIIKRTYSRSVIIQNRKYYGLIFFVSLPLPFTGVWTGALAANLIGLSKYKSTLAIIIGVFISSTIVTSFVKFGLLTITSLQ